MARHSSQEECSIPASRRNFSVLTSAFLVQHTLTTLRIVLQDMFRNFFRSIGDHFQYAYGFPTQLVDALSQKLLGGANLDITLLQPCCLFFPELFSFSPIQNSSSFNISWSSCCPLIQMIEFPLKNLQKINYIHSHQSKTQRIS